MFVTVWNSYKAKGITQYDLLLKFEDENGGISTTIEVNDENQLHSYLEATYNETDVELEYYIHPEPKHTYDVDPFDNNLVQFARLISELNGVINDSQIFDVATSMDLNPSEVSKLIERAEKVFDDAKILKDEDPMITRRARATINGDKDYTVNYDEGIEIVATDGRTLYDIDINDDGSLLVGVSGVIKHKGQLLDDHMVISPKGYGRVKIDRTKYEDS